MFIVLWMFLAGTFMCCSGLGKEASLSLGPRSVEDRGYGFISMKRGLKRSRNRRKTRKTILQLIDLIKELQDSGLGRQSKEDVKRKAERQPAQGVREERGQRRAAKEPTTSMPKGHDKRLAPKPHATKKTKGHDERWAPKPPATKKPKDHDKQRAEVSFKEKPQKGGQRKGDKIPVRPKKWKNIEEERDGLVIALLVQMEDVPLVSKNVAFINHLDKHIFDLEAATKDDLGKVILKVQQCRCQDPKWKKKEKDETPKPRIGQRKLKKLLAEKRRLIDELHLQVENLDPVDENVPIIYHLDGHILDLQLAGEGTMGAVIAETKNCQCQAYPEDNDEEICYWKWKKLIAERDDLVYELMVQVEKKDPTSANLEVIDHLENHIWELDLASTDELKMVIRNIMKCSCQAALPKDYRKDRKKKKPRFWQKRWKKLLTERNKLVENLSAQIKEIADNYKEYSSITVHLQRHLWLLQRAKGGDIEFLIEKILNCWCQTSWQNEDYEDYEDYEDAPEDAPDDIEEYSSPYEKSSFITGLRQQRGEFQGRETRRRGDILTSLDEAESSLANIVGQQILQQMKEGKNAFIEKLKEYDEERELLKNERGALDAEMELLNQGKAELDIERRQFHEEKVAFEMELIQRGALDLDRDVLQREREAFSVELVDMREELRREKENLAKTQARFDKDAEDLKLEREALQSELRLFCTQVFKMKEELREEKEALIMAQKKLEMDIAAFTKEREEFERDVKRQGIKDREEEQKEDSRLQEKFRNINNRSVGTQTKRPGTNSMQDMREELRKFPEDKLEERESRQEKYTNEKYSKTNKNGEELNADTEENSENGSTDRRKWNRCTKSNADRKKNDLETTIKDDRRLKISSEYERLQLFGGWRRALRIRANRCLKAGGRALRMRANSCSEEGGPALGMRANSSLEAGGHALRIRANSCCRMKNSFF
ncbi:uncharacterized protein LOC135209781 [Macrobrachium nipponense]|uniref:uncharacterized protein LOC135209781 n=1 Tax=Macrobrachium nipponense TaxID=159736 RepID=UPI0030C875C6